MKWADTLRTWLEKNPGRHTIAAFCDANGITAIDKRKRFGSEASKLVALGHLSVHGRRPKQYAFIRHPISPAEHLRRIAEKSAAKRRLDPEKRAENRRAYARKYHAENRERINELHCEARLRRGRNKSRRVMRTPEEREALRLQAEARRRERRAARAKPEPKPRQPRKAKPARAAVAPRIVVAVEQKGSARVELAVKLPSSEDFVAAGGKIEVLPGFGARVEHKATGLQAIKERTRAHNEARRRA